MVKTADSKKMGLISVVLLGINGMIGSGIFLLPGKVFALAGHSSHFVYIFVMLLVLAIAWCFAQCAALFNRNGGAYVYAKEAFGSFIGFEIGFMRWIVGAMGWAALIVGFVTALSSVWPQALEEPVRSTLILALIGALLLFNLAGTRALKHLNNVITIAKLLPLLVFILAGAFYVEHTHLVESPPSEWDSASFGGAAIMIFYAFGGFETLVVAAGEMKNPTKNLPIAVMTIITVCSLLYFLIQIIAMGILGPALSDSSAPLADAGECIFGTPGRWLVTLTMLISIGGVNISASFIIPRSGVALAEDGMITKRFAETTRSGAPIWAILVTTSFTVIIALSGNFAELVAISVVSRFAQYGATCVAVIVLYKRRQMAIAPFKKVLLAIIPVIALAGLFWMALQATPSQLYWGLGTLLSGVPLYLIQKNLRRVIKWSEATSL